MESNKLIWDVSTTKHHAYIPTPSDLKIIQPKSKNTLRYLYEIPAEKLTSDETNSIKELKTHLIKKLSQQELGIISEITDGTFLRYMYSRKFNFEKVTKSLKADIEYQNVTDMIPAQLRPSSQQLEILQSGCFYSFGRDNSYRPIQHFNVKKMLKATKKYTTNTIKDTQHELTDYIEKYILIKGKIEQWVIFMDWDKVKTLKKKKINMMNKLVCNDPIYKTRFYKNYWFNCGANVKMLNPNKNKSEWLKYRIKVIDGCKLDNIWIHIDHYQVQKKFGGLLDNIESEFWPPKSPPPD